MSIDKIRTLWRKYPLLFYVFMSAAIGIAGVFCWMVLISFGRVDFGALLELLMVSLLAGIALGETAILPVFLMAAEIHSLYCQMKGKPIDLKMRTIDLVTIILGIIYNILLLSFVDSVLFLSDWHEVLYNAQKHTPINTENYLTVWVIIGVAILGYLIVNFIPIDKMPPLVLVLGISSMYLGTLVSILWMVQTVKGKDPLEIMLPILPVCCVCITARSVICKVREWKEKSWESEEKDYGVVLNKCNQLLQNANRWPVMAFFLMWPLLGIIIAILVLFGQKPDAFIKAWTETSDWNLSQRTAPQNLYRDEHYLCTVAAGGHKEVVKPLRLGVRHGHEVIVNRQLCVANAFEQILEERTPRFHKAVRGIYDEYGFPIARLIKSKVAADIVYFVMKPAEWFFLMVIYLVDVKPENRIAIQYTGKHVSELEKCDK